MGDPWTPPRVRGMIRYMDMRDVCFFFVVKPSEPFAAARVALPDWRPSKVVLQAEAEDPISGQPAPFRWWLQLKSPFQLAKARLTLAGLELSLEPRAQPLNLATLRISGRRVLLCPTPHVPDRPSDALQDWTCCWHPLFPPSFLLALLAASIRASVG